MSAPVLTIWGRKTSLNVQKVLWCCVELDIAFERIDWAGPFGGNDDPAYRALNPHGRVPTIKDGDTIVWESNSCLRYLCVTRGGERLYPNDAAGRSQVERWMDWQLATLNPPMTTLLLGYYRTPEDKRNPAALEAARLQALEQWSILDNELAKRPFLAGNGMTLADIGNGILAYRWYNYPIERPQLPHVKAWHDRLIGRPGFAAHVAGPIS